MKKEFDDLEVTFLRHCISAHPVNYSDETRKTNFKIDRNSINNWGLLSIREEFNNTKTYNLFVSLDEYFFKQKNVYKLSAKN
ncbi:MAG: hypothetical protein QM802_24820 [Agriterribacter sp.]